MSVIIIIEVGNKEGMEGVKGRKGEGVGFRIVGTKILTIWGGDGLDMEKRRGTTCRVSGGK